MYRNDRIAGSGDRLRVMRSKNAPDDSSDVGKVGPSVSGLGSGQAPGSFGGAAGATSADGLKGMTNLGRVAGCWRFWLSLTKLRTPIRTRFVLNLGETGKARDRSFWVDVGKEW
jgi:hypothetical protein